VFRVCREKYPVVVTFVGHESEALRCSLRTENILQTAKLSVCKSVIVPILIYTHKSGNIGRVLSQVEAAEMEFLPTNPGVTFRYEMRSCKMSIPVRYDYAFGT